MITGAEGCGSGVGTGTGGRPEAGGRLGVGVGVVSGEGSGVAVGAGDAAAAGEGAGVGLAAGRAEGLGGSVRISSRARRKASRRRQRSESGSPVCAWRKGVASNSSIGQRAADEGSGGHHNRRKWKSDTAGSGRLGRRGHRRVGMMIAAGQSPDADAPRAGWAIS